jgi:hypothetical protein
VLKKNMFDITEKFFNLDNIIIIPMNWGTTKHYEVSFQGWNVVNLWDEEFVEALKMVSEFFKVFVQMYKKTHVFSQPQICWIPEKKTIVFKIGTLEIETYEKKNE